MEDEASALQPFKPMFDTTESSQAPLYENKGIYILQNRSIRNEKHVAGIQGGQTMMAQKQKTPEASGWRNTRWRLCSLAQTVKGVPNVAFRTCTAANPISTLPYPTPLQALTIALG
jgi:hypothetical protein